ncbi:MAG TPA: hypothetical protein VLA89_17325 [Gemmatimonadales bacterium]|nr:hypothetical protein [Gemmatimonadales bacterium]
MAIWSYTPQQTLTETLTLPVQLERLSPRSDVTGYLVNTTTGQIRLRYSIVETAQCTSMAALFIASQGPFKALQLYNPQDDAVHTVRFDSTMTLELFQPGYLRTNDIVFTLVRS